MDNANTPTTPATTVVIHPRVLLGALITAILLTLGIAAASFWLSFAALRDLAAMAGTEPDRAWVIPIVLDGAIVATTVTAIALSHHTDPRTVRGRRFVLTILAVAAGASIAGNAYHATLASTVLPAIVAAGIATIAPVFLLAMTEVLAVILRAPRRQRTASPAPSVDIPIAVSQRDSSSTSPEAPNDDATENVEDLVDDHGNLPDEVWETVDLYLNHPEVRGNFSAVARALGVKHASTITRRYDRWIELQRTVAAAKAPKALQHHTARGDVTHNAANNFGAELDHEQHTHDNHDQPHDSDTAEAGAEHDYVGAGR